MLRYLLTDNPPSPGKGWPHHRGIRVLLFSNRGLGAFTFHKNHRFLWNKWKCCETGAIFFRLYPRRLADVITKAVLSSQLFKDPECWSGWDLNPQPSAQQSGALPTELTGRRRSWPVSCKTTSNLAEFFQSVLNARLDTVCHKRVAMRVISH